MTENDDELKDIHARVSSIVQLLADTIRASEREACAKAVERVIARLDPKYQEDEIETCKTIAAAIRARN